ncbi:MAG: polymer-forming cytoskeletal protein [Acidobacteria bacterium]|nr:polymer-forming cytoskeletal protein [Acidobacteriota bacterium]
MISGKKTEHSAIGGMLGEGVKIEGNLSFKQTFRIDGEFKGKINNSERLVIGEKGFVSGEIECDSLICYGKITGTMKIKGCVEVHPKGRIEGDLIMENPLLTVLEGGIIAGTIKMSSRISDNLLPIKEKAKD